jgi:hypothetical protein
MLETEDFALLVVLLALAVASSEDSEDFRDKQKRNRDLES